MTKFLVVGVTVSCIGLAERSLDLFREHSTRTRFSTGKPVGQRSLVRHDFSVAAHGVEAARVYAGQFLTEAWEQRQRDEPITRADEARIRSMDSCVGGVYLDAVCFCYRALDAVANFVDHPMAQLNRDMLAASNHVFISEITMSSTACTNPERIRGASARARTLAEESVTALEVAGFFAMASPREVGGYDVHPATQVEVFEELASADVSSGWVAMI